MTSTPSLTSAEGPQVNLQEVATLVYIGMDWSQAKHDVCFLDAAGEPIARVMLPHSPKGFARFEAYRQRMGVTATDCLVGIETAHNLVIDFLWGRVSHSM